MQGIIPKGNLIILQLEGCYILRDHCAVCVNRNRGLQDNKDLAS